ncbi:MAG: hypothetical protein AB7R55_22365 [Gemmatimonadales bacterium]
MAAGGALPAGFDIDQPDRRLRQAMEAVGLEVIDLLEPRRAASEEGVTVCGDVYRRFSPDGHAAMTRVLLPRVLRELAARPGD